MSAASSKTRTETDALGTREIPKDAYYGIHTVRSLENFKISSRRVHPELIRALAQVKRAAAMANMELGLLKKTNAEAIVRSAREVAEGKLRDQFMIDAFQMGAGTSLNMNMNEVLANRAIEILGGTKGDYSLVHPNDHVNMAQSTNDTYPTAMRVASRARLGLLPDVLEKLAGSFEDRGRAFFSVIKSARTHLQDAVPIRLGQELRGYGATARKCREEVLGALDGLEELGIGGSAAGTGINVHPDYRRKVVASLSQWYEIGFRPASDLFEAMQSNLCITRASSALKLTAVEFDRIANDLRLLSSGPTTGLAEIRLPAVQPGSSIMPGKVNPSIPEMVNMVCFQVIGNDLTIAQAAKAGQLDLNVMMPVMSMNLLESCDILLNALKALDADCVAGLEADETRCRRYAEQSMSLATALNPSIGYAKAAEIAKESLRTGKTIPELVRDKGLLPNDKIEKILDLEKMTGEQE